MASAWHDGATGGGGTARAFTPADVAKPDNAVMVSGILESVCCPTLVIMPSLRVTERLAVPHPFLNVIERAAPGRLSNVAVAVQSLATETSSQGTVSR